MASEFVCAKVCPSNSGDENSSCVTSKVDVLFDRDLSEVKTDNVNVNIHKEDAYEHIKPGILYSDVNIPGPGANLDDFNSQLAKGCDCINGECRTTDCNCIFLYGLNYSDRLLIGDKMGEAIVECNSECICSSNQGGPCGNRLVQLGPLVDLEVFDTENKGYGLRCRNNIKRGTFICEYAGEVVDIEEARRRFTATASGMNYVFVLNEFSGEKLIRTCVDPEHIGNIGRYVNHCCRPNSAVVPVRAENPVPRLAIFAVQDLDAGEEITFDYGGGEKRATGGTDAKLCRCDAANCRRYLPFDDTLA